MEAKINEDERYSKGEEGDHQTSCVAHKQELPILVKNLLPYSFDGLLLTLCQSNRQMSNPTVEGTKLVISKFNVFS